tara:strand:+ start:637 stop:873 length:237 start_codon:yes stop_codon:yes gene_type:complete
MFMIFVRAGMLPILGDRSNNRVVLGEKTISRLRLSEVAPFIQTQDPPYRHPGKSRRTEKMPFFANQQQNSAIHRQLNS